MINRVFLDKKMNERISKLIDVCNSAVLNYGMLLNNEKERDTQKQDLVDLSMAEFEKILDDIRQEFHDTPQG